MLILVVEDNDALASMLVRLLGGKGHEVRPLSSGREALAAAAEQPPDVVLIDLHLPDMDGFAVARTMRGRPETKEARLIGLTGDSSAVDDQGLLDELLPKPIALQELVALIEC